MLTSFAASVVLVRLYLALAGYPQLGGGSLHIAHVLWGGLMLFVASMLPLIFSNRWVYTAGGVLSGAGVGLFIDEVGKFITAANDYFYQPAAPIIYAFFLLTVWLYFQVGRSRASDARSELYGVLDSLSEVLDADMDARERDQLIRRLEVAAGSAEQPDLARLAQVLLDFLRSESLHVVPETGSVWTRWREPALRWEARWLHRRPLQLLLALVLLVLGVSALASVLLWWGLLVVPGLLRGIPAVPSGQGTAVTEGGINWFLVRAGLEGSVGLLLVAGARYFLGGDDRRGVSLSHVGLLLGLTTVNLLVFYFDQFKAVFDTLQQFGVLLAVNYYRQRFLSRADEAESLPSTAKPASRE